MINIVTFLLILYLLAPSDYADSTDPAQTTGDPRGASLFGKAHMVVKGPIYSVSQKK